MVYNWLVADVPHRRNRARKGAKLSEESGLSEGRQERNNMNIDNGIAQQPIDLFISDDGSKEARVINRLLGTEKTGNNLVKALKLLLRKELPYDEIIKFACNSYIAREVFVAAFLKEPIHSDDLFMSLYMCLEEPKKYQITTYDGALFGLATAVFEVGCMLDASMKGKKNSSSYEEIITLPILSLVKINDEKFHNFFLQGPRSDQFSQLSEMIKKYYRAEGDGSGDKQCLRLEQARQISAKIVNLLPSLPVRGTGHLGEYIMSQIAYAIFSPLNPRDQIKAVSLILDK